MGAENNMMRRAAERRGRWCRRRGRWQRSSGTHTATRSPSTTWQPASRTRPRSTRRCVLLALHRCPALPLHAARLHPSVFARMDISSTGAVCFAQPCTHANELFWCLFLHVCKLWLRTHIFCLNRAGHPGAVWLWQHAHVLPACRVRPTRGCVLFACSTRTCGRWRWCPCCWAVDEEMGPQLLRWTPPATLWATRVPALFPLQHAQNPLRRALEISYKWSKRAFDCILVKPRSPFAVSTGEVNRCWGADASV